MDLSIIVPVYNVEEYIRPCLNSIFQQGLDEYCYEVIIVNDGTRDRSMEVIQDIIEAHCNIIVINQDNLGLSSARNTGLLKATGDYIQFVDSDDLLVVDSLGHIMEDIRQKQPELFIAGFVKKTNEEIMNGWMPEQNEYNSFPKPEFMETIEQLNPRECYVWRTLYKRSFLNDNAIRFIPSIYFEDIPFSAECYLKAKKCIISNCNLYIYRQRPDSIVSTINLKKIMDFNIIIARLWKMRTMAKSTKEYTCLMNLIFNTHQLQTWFIAHDEELVDERKSITDDLKKKVPNLYFCGGIIEHTESFLYSFFPNTYLWLRSLFK
jgi:glycosyltransferase involved in cell wall biosynthesis